jgi:hypothetical protein
MKKANFTLIMVLTIVMLFTSIGLSSEWQELVDQVGNGNVNWTTGVIQATGIGAPPEKYYGKPQARPMALRAAKLDALRNLLEITKGVQIDSSTMVRDFAVENDIIMSKVEGLVKGAQVVKREYLDDGTVEIVMQMSLNGGFAQLVLPQDIKSIDPIKPVQTPEEPSATVKTPDTPETAVPSDVFTGLVIDARGLKTRPAMAPKIMDETGQEIYGSAFVSREYAVQQGMAGYAKDLTAAQSNPRVTNNPLTVKGLKTSGAGNCDIGVSNADAAKLRSASENLSFLRKCRVMIVVD